ncbi:FG-GAP repeat domain-containing protein [Urbifossiella limnaea]|uniref:FG-GAP repeat domain-containing protein n=1 Tax=Urbifossiella limnaea TaxID=2528023 RepID=UPI0011A42EC7|nr:VCBS repeat-containing protein [Urbifossiella limnaea]
MVFENDYSQDVFGYFTPERRALLEYAQQQLLPYLQDNLAAITPDPARGNNWSIQFLNTATGQNVVIPNPTIPASVIRIYAWGAPAGSFPRPDTLATGASAGFSAQGYPAWYDTIVARGQTGRLATPVSDTSVFAIRIDVNMDVPQYESTTPPPPGSPSDLVSTLQHELLHGLGFTSSNPATVRWINPALEFIGPAVFALTGQPVPTGGSHWAPGLTIDGVPALMGPYQTNQRLSTLDAALLADIGWESGVPPPGRGVLGSTGGTPGLGDPLNDPPSTLSGRFAVGQGGGEVAAISNPDGTPVLLATPFPDFAGGVRTAAADFNRDGIPDLVVGTGPGTTARVRVLDGRDARELFAITPFGDFTGGVYVAAGDLNGDRVADLVISPDEGGGPRVLALSGLDNFATLADFFGIADPNFRGGCRVAVGDVNGDGFGDLLVAAGVGGGPRVSGYDGKSLAAGAFAPVFPDFFVFEETLRNGAFIAVGDVDADGRADLIAGGGPGGGPRVLVLSGQALVGGVQQPLGDFFAGDTGSRGGVRVTARDLNADGRADVITGSGDDAGTRLNAYDTSSMTPTGGTPRVLISLDFTQRFPGGLFVG